MNWQRIIRRALDIGLKETKRRASRGTKTSDRGQIRRPHAPTASGYPGDYSGPLIPIYDPHPDGQPDPGEIVWTWVPYEEDHSQGKDRPVLLIGRDGPWLLGLQVTSKDHDRDAAQEARAGRYWEDIGSGDWDTQQRPSEVRVNRFLRIHPDRVRRIGAILSEDTFARVAKAVARHS